MATYEVTITRTGGILVKANSEEEAVEVFRAMTLGDIETHGQLTGWEASDSDEIDEEGCVII